MKKPILFAILFCLLAGCTQIKVYTGPLNEKELFPDQRVEGDRVLMVFTGEPAFVAEFYSEANGKLVAKMAEAGASPALSYNGQRPVRWTTRTLNTGRYRVIIKPFYYVSYAYPTVRKRVDLPEQQGYISLYPEKQPIYDADTGRYWADILRIDTGFIPHEHFQSPTINIQGAGFFSELVNGMRKKGVIK